MLYKSVFPIFIPFAECSEIYFGDEAAITPAPFYKKVLEIPRNLLRVCFIFIIFIFTLNLYPQSVKKLDQDKISLIYDAVFEVVIKKPFDNPFTKDNKIKQNREKEIREDPLVYQEPIPWDSMPYSLKVDEYYSIGTAFAISENTYLTASHVVNLDKKMLFENVYIPDRNGNVNEIDQILKYSNFRDFVIFTLKNKTNSKFLKINTDYNLNTTVFAVGNALGEGIVIRDGLLTSLTKESENGEWDWIRFSAAASPGNSGGPLLNENGEVIGLILRKSQDENLNYALPMKELSKINDNKAVFHAFSNYSLIITTKKFGPKIFDKEIDLPMDYKKLREIIIDFIKEISINLKNGLISSYNNILFPNGTGSANLLHLNTNITFPNLIAENENDGIWDIYRPKDLKNSQLDNNGYFNYGTLVNLGAFELRKPDNVSLKDVLDNSKIFMDLFLKGYTLNRNFNDKNIRVVSLGEPLERYEYIDNYKRKWIVESWLLEFANSKILVFSLPTPAGRVGFFYLNDIHYIDTDLLIDLQVYTDYIYYSYNATFGQWKEFLSFDKYLPDIFKSYNFKFDDKNMDFKCSRFSVSYGKDFFNFDDNSYLVLKNSYFKDNDRVVWDISGLSIWENKNEKNHFTLARTYKPEKFLPDIIQNEWKNLISRKFPNNRMPTNENNSTMISDLQKNYSSINAADIGKLDKVYSLGLSLEGKIPDEEIKKKFDLLDSRITVYEDVLNTKTGKMRH